MIILPALLVAVFVAERGFMIGAIATTACVVVSMLLLNIIAERYYLKRLKKVKAISPESAVTREEAKTDPGPIATGALKRLTKRKKVRVTENGRYYVGCKDKKHC